MEFIKNYKKNSAFWINPHPNPPRWRGNKNKPVVSSIYKKRFTPNPRCCKWNKLKNDIFKVLIELFIFDRKKRSIIKARLAKQNLEKYLDIKVSDTQKNKKALSTDKNISEKAASMVVQSEVDVEAQNKFVATPLSTDKIYLPPIHLPLWQYWHQGKEKAPDLIQKCFESVEKFESDKEIHVLSFDTIKDYVELPQKYYDLLNSGKIPIAIFSDILRLYLLEKYGGGWVDSTIYLTDKIPQSVWNSDFCVVQKNPLTDLQENKMSCYFIRAKKESANLRAIKQSIENYWAENDFLINYFMFEHISTMLSCKTPELKAEWDRMPYLSGESSGKLQNILFDDFNKNVWDKIVKETCIHKLSYKILREKVNKNSYYNWIINR